MFNNYAGYNYTERSIYYNNKSISYSKISLKEIEEIINYNIKTLKEYFKKNKSNNKKIIEYRKNINSIINEITSLKDSIIINLNDKSDYYINFIKNICIEFFDFTEQIKMNDIEMIIKNYDHYQSNLKELNIKISNIHYLELFSDIKEKNITIIGGNGSGKSSFVSLLKQIYGNSMVIIPAQKLLQFDRTIPGIIDTKEEDIKKLQNIDSIESQRDQVYINSSPSSTVFSKLIISIANTHIKQLNYLREKNFKKRYKTILDEINEICKNFLKIKFVLDDNDYSLSVIDENNNIYSVNSLSDGEKAILYYVGNILYANKNSYIVVDEPETHLNPTIYNKLWDILELKKKDCQFIYVSHDVNFIKSRKNKQIFWMKKYIHPGNWCLKELDNIIPDDLVVEVYGSKNKILFCESEKGKDDEKIYNSIFGKVYTVIPVESCSNVINYTKAFNRKKEFHNNEAIGIIDNDNRSELEIEELKKDNIYATKFNELEMMLCDEEVIRSVFGKSYSVEEINRRIELFKNKFVESINNEKNKIILSFLKMKLDHKFKKFNLKAKDINDISAEIKNFIDSLNYENDIMKYNGIIDNYIIQKDYEGLLKICTLKGEIVDGLGNNILDNDFKNKAINNIIFSKSNYIKSKYFSDVK